MPTDRHAVPACGVAKISAGRNGRAAGGRLTRRLRRPTSVDDLYSAIVQIKTYINPDGRTVRGLGQQRSGSGIVIDDKGLILTIGYLMVEAHSAEVTVNGGRKVGADVVGYDHDTGFGLLRALEPLKVKPLLFGKAADLKEKDQVLAASFGGRAGIAPAYIISKREFAASWEYMIDGALFTAPAHSEWSGAALVTRDGQARGRRLAGGRRRHRQGRQCARQHVRADRPAAADHGRPARRRPGRRTGTAVARAQCRGPARAAVRRPRDRRRPGGQSRHPARRHHRRIERRAPKTLADFYRKLWSLGGAGVTVSLDLLQEGGVKRVDVSR